RGCTLPRYSASRDGCGCSKVYWTRPKRACVGRSASPAVRRPSRGSCAPLRRWPICWAIAVTAPRRLSYCDPCTAGSKKGSTRRISRTPRPCLTSSTRETAPLGGADPVAEKRACTGVDSAGLLRRGVRPPHPDVARPDADRENDERVEQIVQRPLPHRNAALGNEHQETQQKAQHQGGPAGR